MIWLIGDTGMLDAELSRLFRRSGEEYIGTGSDIDISNLGEIREFARDKVFGWIVNCAAYTAVDQAEKDADASHRVNRDGPENLGRLASDIGAKIIHFSTDYVFDGVLSRPYREDDPVSPLSAYGRSKAEGDAALLRVCNSAFIVRTGWLYGVFGKNFVLKMIRAMQERGDIRVIDDQKGSPTYAPDLAAVVGLIISGNSKKYGVYNFTNEGETTWFEYALEILRLALSHKLVSNECRMVPISSAEYDARAKRLAYSVLSKEKIVDTFGIRIAPWRDALGRFFCELQLHTNEGRL
jgi:dTDP-4-dehydrorhamnose reductase